MNPFRILLALAVLASFCLLPFGAAMAQSDEDFIKYRQRVMSSLGDNMGGIGDILKKNLPVKENIAEHAAAINAASKMIVRAFAQDVSAGATDAKPNVWSDRSGFEAAAKDLQEASAKLMSAAAGNMSGLGDAVKATGKTCGGCHKEYRKDKEDSYKKKM